jgi:alkyl sulfatase BDS1-like metallo-beta-lactamase superfamily hydrolase
MEIDQKPEGCGQVSLYKVVDRLYQVHGYDIAVMTLFDGERA